MNLNWGAWLSGLISAVATGIVTIIGVMAAYGEPPKNWWAWVILSLPAGKAFWDYIKQSPPPIGKIVGILLVFFLLTGCAGVRIWTLEMSQEDLANAVVSRQVADNLISTWSLNSGVMTCGTEDFLPPLMAKKITAIDESVKKLGKWSEEDWAKGCFLGRRVNLTVDQAKALIDLIIPLVTKVIGQ